MKYIFLNLFFLLSIISNAQNWKSFTDSIGTFSSPRSPDLIGDGVMDIIIGGGTNSLFSNNGVMAYDGVDGTLLWNRSSRDELFGSAIFQDLNSADINDVIISGRDVQLLAIFGDESNPHLISTTGNFYQDPNASDFQQMINPALIGSSIPGFENIGFDSWLTIGDNYTPSNNASSIGELNWSTFSASDWIVGGLINSDAAIFRIPSDDECLPDNNNKVLLGQFTTDGELSGYINLSGLNPDGSTWTETNIPIPFVQSPNSINEAHIEQINIYPNPSTGIFSVEFSSLITQDVTVRVINALGETVFTNIIKNHAGDHSMNIDISSLSKGLYFLQLETGDRLINNKIKLN
jgi:hypothetical protein